MGNRRIHDTAKRIAIRLSARDPQRPLHRAEILQICDMSVRTLQRARRRWCETGNVAKVKALGRGRPRLLNNMDIKYLITLCRHKPTRFLDEYQQLLEQWRYNSVGLTVIHRALEREGFSVKRIQKVARERSKEKIAEFIHNAAQYTPLQLVSIDEMSKDDRTYTRLFGREVVGKRLNWMIASKVIEGSFTNDEFLVFLERNLVSHVVSAAFTSKN
ncbi:hypothetical protein K435DRAFT_750698 [Dendrothele bispora CBS 962.96]|uniref:Winged helix-turn helix domain-containing protein n=1 Tax=Dendrothele bispora (strain CBS 962.96) TaxID=1314807 RepID=A0A4S8MEE0_DENBC|nr:hypothetical protein K435DRAFT_756906 [Dendrothele bispora CBS 962.96]THV00975.1 hypothetical protein K435DRAFT_750698 [Dendrothele bispora CBS 962.96]